LYREAIGRIFNRGFIVLFKLRDIMRVCSHLTRRTCTTYRLDFDARTQPDLLVIEASNNVVLPPRYLNPDGQIKLVAPSAERDFHGPPEPLAIDPDNQLEPDLLQGDLALARERQIQAQPGLVSSDVQLVGQALVQDRRRIALAGDPRTSTDGAYAVYSAALANGGSLDDARKGLDFFKALHGAGNLLPQVATSASVDDGQTHFEDVPIELSANGSSETSKLFNGTRIIFRTSAHDQFVDWHHAPRRQFVITLSGEAEVEGAGGEKRHIGPGTILLAEDLTGKGHITRGLGTQERVSLFIPLSD